MTDDDLQEIRLTAASRGWKLLCEAMVKKAEGERKEMYAVDSKDDRRREIAYRQAGRDDVLSWFADVIQRGGG